jgi:hypothetical protein
MTLDGRYVNGNVALIAKILCGADLSPSPAFQAMTPLI